MIRSYSVLQKSDLNITRTPFFGDNSFDSYKNSFILDTTMDYLIKTRSFDESLFSGHQ